MNIEILSEAELQDRLVNWFSKWFDVYFEQRSDCGKCRIDLLLYHQSDYQREFPIGVEIKKDKLKRGVDIAKWCLQSQRYATTTFGGKKAHIFTAPQISGWYLEEGRLVNKHKVENDGVSGMHHNVNSFLYRGFGIGELQKYVSNWPDKGKTSYRLVLNQKAIWESTTPYTFNSLILQNL